MSASGLRIAFVCTAHEGQASLSSWHEEAAPGELPIIMAGRPDSPKVVDQAVYSYGVSLNARSL
jgi:hypothetical protein